MHQIPCPSAAVLLSRLFEKIVHSTQKNFQGTHMVGNSTEPGRVRPLVKQAMQLIRALTDLLEALGHAFARLLQAIVVQIFHTVGLVGERCDFPPRGHHLQVPLGPAAPNLQVRQEDAQRVLLRKICAQRPSQRPPSRIDGLPSNIQNFERKARHLRFANRWHLAHLHVPLLGILLVAPPKIHRRNVGELQLHCLLVRLVGIHHQRLQDLLAAGRSRGHLQICFLIRILRPFYNVEDLRQVGESVPRLKNRLHLIIRKL
mmetsp:Transcript_19652/g.47620  ORF Transcript_19652/g.47620 Transcript_19652/m.47620 type:complete len:259 (-) Transcript_19652:1426-2202(-)